MRARSRIASSGFAFVGGGLGASRHDRRATRSTWQGPPGALDPLRRGQGLDLRARRLARLRAPPRLRAAGESWVEIESSSSSARPARARAWRNASASQMRGADAPAASLTSILCFAGSARTFRPAMICPPNASMTRSNGPFRTLTKCSGRALGCAPCPPGPSPRRRSGPAGSRRDERRRASRR